MNPSRSLLSPTRPHEPLSPAELGMLVTIASLGMLFGTLLLTYILARVRVPVWPPIGVEPLPALRPTLSTVALLLSSLSVYQAQRAFAEERSASFRRLWRLTIGLGFLFLVLQASVWQQLWSMGVKLQSNIFASIVYTLTFVHALHVFMGLAGLVYTDVRARQVDFAPSATQAPKLWSWFWHFLDLVWFVMFVLLVCI